MRLNQQEEDLFNEIDKIQFDFRLDDDLNDLNKNDKEKVIEEIKIFENDIENIESEAEKNNE